MKKNTLSLLAGICLLLTGCGGTKYTNSASVSEAGLSIGFTQELTLNKDSFKLNTTIETSITNTMGALAGLGGGFNETYVCLESGTLEAVEGKENVYKLVSVKLVFSGYEIEGDGAAEYSKITKAAMQTTYDFTDDEVEKFLAGKKVVKELEEADFVTSYAKVNPETKTFAAI